MNLLDYAQFGVAIFAIACLGFVIKQFISFLKKQEDNFTEIIKNHLKHSTEAEKEVATSNIEMTTVIKQLIRFLERNNR